MAEQVLLSGASGVACHIATGALDLCRLFVKEKTIQSMEQMIDNNYIDQHHSRTLANKQTALDLIARELDDIKQGIGILRNKEYEAAKNYFTRAIRWRNDKKEFKKCIEKCYDKCTEAKGPSIVESFDKLCLYSLRISSGFIYHSNYGKDYIKGLRHIYYTLCDMNKDDKLRTDLGVALGSKYRWGEKYRKLLKAIICFAVRASSFIKQVQTAIELSIDVKETEDSEQKNQENVFSDDEKHIELLQNSKLVDMSVYDANNGVMTREMYLSDTWLPRYYDGYYFGNVGVDALKCENYLRGRYFRDAMDAKQGPFEVVIDDTIIHTKSFDDAWLSYLGNRQKHHHWFDCDEWVNVNETKSFEILVVRKNGAHDFFELDVCNHNSLKYIQRQIEVNFEIIADRFDLLTPNGFSLLYQKCYTLFEHGIRDKSIVIWSKKSATKQMSVVGKVVVAPLAAIRSDDPFRIYKDLWNDYDKVRSSTYE